MRNFKINTLCQISRRR